MAELTPMSITSSMGILVNDFSRKERICSALGGIIVQPKMPAPYHSFTFVEDAITPSSSTNKAVDIKALGASTKQITGTVRQEGNTIADATVMLFIDIGDNDSFSSDNAIATTKTASDGTYSFTYLSPNIKYAVMIITPDNTLYQSVVFDNITPG